MKTLLYILIAPIRFSVSAVGGVVTALLLSINWCLTGSWDHNEGLIGFLLVVIPTWLLEKVNNPLVKFHKELKPVAWTFKKAVSVYRETIRHWEDMIAGNFEYEKHGRECLAICEKEKNNRMTRFWLSALKRGKVKRREDAIKWNAKVDEYEKNPRPGYTMTRNVVEAEVT